MKSIIIIAVASVPVVGISGSETKSFPDLLRHFNSSFTAIPVGDMAEERVISPSTSSSYWSVGAGLAWRRIGSTTVAPNLAANNPPAAFFSPSAGPGAATGIANRNYDNGFVRIGAGTPISGQTTNFSFQNNSQFNAAADTLTFTSSGGVALENPGSGRDGDDTAASPYIELSYLVPVREDLEGGFTFSLSTSGLNSSVSSSFNSFNVTTTDTFNLNGVIPPLTTPLNPFVGSFTGPGPLIPNAPANRAFTQTLDGTQNFLFESETDLYSVAFGGDIRWKIDKKWFLEAGVGAVVNFIDWDARSSTVLINPATNALVPVSASSSGTEILLGVYAQVGIGYKINDNWSADGFFRYDITEDLRGSVGGSNFDVDLSGWSIGGGLSYRF